MAAERSEIGGDIRETSATCVRPIPPLPSPAWAHADYTVFSVSNDGSPSFPPCVNGTTPLDVFREPKRCNYEFDRLSSKFMKVRSTREEKMANSDVPEIRSSILIPRGGHLPHDTDGKLLRMGHNATGKVFAAQQLPNSSPLKRQLLKQAMCIRLEERQGWLAVRTREFPAGDLEGAAQASLAIACYYLELQELEKGHKWLEKALEEAPKDKALVCAAIEHNMSIVKQIMQSCSASSTPAQSRSSSPVRNNTPSSPTQSENLQEPEQHAVENDAHNDASGNNNRMLHNNNRMFASPARMYKATPMFIAHQPLHMRIACKKQRG